MKIIRWIKGNDLLDPLVNLVKKVLREAAMNLCIKTIKMKMIVKVLLISLQKIRMSNKYL